MRTSQLALCIGLLLAGSGAYSDTTFTGTGSWHDPNRWSAGVPTASTKAIVSGYPTVTADAVGSPIVIRGGAVTVQDAGFSSSDTIYFGNGGNDVLSFTATDADVSAPTFYFNFSQEGNGRVLYSQTGGTFTSGSLTEFYGGVATTAQFENVSASFNGSRFVIARRAAPSLISFKGGAFTNNAPILMGLWGKPSGRFAFDGTTVRMNGKIDVGYGNDEAEEPSEICFADCAIEQNQQLNVGIAQRYDDASPMRKSYGRVVMDGCTWTNVTANRATYIGGGGAGTGSFGHLILSNTVFSSGYNSDSRVVLGQLSGTSGRIDVVGGRFSCPWLYLGYASGARGTIAWHGLKGLTAVPSDYKYVVGAHTEVELVDCELSSPSALTIGRDEAAGSHTLRLVGGSCSVTGNLILGSTATTQSGATGRLETDGATVTLDGSGTLAVGRNTGHAGSALFRKSTVSANIIDVCQTGTTTSSLTNTGSKVALNYLRLPAAAGSTAYYRDGDGSETTVNTDFRGCHAQGTLIAEIGGKMSVPSASGRFFTCMKDNSTSRITVTPTGLIDVGEKTVNLGWSGYSSVSSLEFQGVVFAKTIAPYNANESKPSGELYFNGGTFKASADATEILHGALSKCAVGAGGAKFDSNGHAVTSAHALVHDDRSGAAAKDGGIVKMGEGTVTLKGALTFNGPVRVEKGTLDLSATTYAATPGISGSGALKVPAGGLTVTGESKFGNGYTGVTVDGAVTFGTDATVTCDDPDALEVGKPYTLLTATSVTSTPKMDLPKKRGVIYDVVNTGTAIVCTARKPGLILVVQ